MFRHYGVGLSKFVSMKDIPGFERRYAATEDGRIWSYPKKWKTGKGKVTIQHEGKWLRQFGDRYLEVYLTKEGIGRTYKVHRLIALAFLDKMPNKTYVDHIDRNSKNNRAENLRWVNGTENIMNSVRKVKKTCPSCGQKIIKDYYPVLLSTREEAFA